MRSVDASAGGAFLAVETGQSAQLAGATLAAGSGAVATAIIRETDGSGRILCKLAALASDTVHLLHPVDYTGNVHVTMTGAGAQLNLYQT